MGRKTYCECEVEANVVTSIPESLKAKIRNKQIIPFIGSGVSCSVKQELFPTWRDLLLRMAEHLEKETKMNEASLVKVKVDMARLFEAAEEAWSALGKSGFNAIMREYFQVQQPPDADLSIVKAIWDLRPRLVITTN